MKNPQEMHKDMGMMQEGMLRIHEQMHKIMDEKNPQERERLMKAQRDMMHQHMQSMQRVGMMGGDGKSDLNIATVKEQKGKEKQH